MPTPARSTRSASSESSTSLNMASHTVRSPTGTSTRTSAARSTATTRFGLRFASETERRVNGLSYFKNGCHSAHGAHVPGDGGELSRMSGSAIESGRARPRALELITITDRGSNHGHGYSAQTAAVELRAGYEL